MKFIALLTALALSGCAIAALPVATQVPLWTAIAGAGAAVGVLAVEAEHSCRADGGCREIPLPP